MVKDIVSKLTFGQKARLLTYYELLDTVEDKEAGIPKIVMADGPHGVRPLRGTPKHIKGGSTAFPTASALSATWNLDMAYKTGAGIARDCLAQGVDVILGPGTNIKRSPLCGRNFEYFSEDPVLSGEISAAYIRGVEDQGVGTSLKHFALNNQETARTLINVEVDERTLREIYLKPFEIAVKKGKPATVMAAYNKALGTYCSQNKKLFDILRNEWNYEGAIISDWTAVRDVPAAFAAGLNLQMPTNKKIEEDLKRGIEEGVITQEQIDKDVEKFLEFVFALHHAPKCEEEFSREGQHEDAYEVACEAITLLKNENNILPVTKEKYRKIYVLGGWAEKSQIMGGGSSIVFTKDEMIDSPLCEIRKAAGDDMEVIYDKCYSEPDYANLGATTITARAAVKDCTDDDLVVCFVSSVCAETEGLDRYHIHFENYIDEIIRVISIKCKNVVVVMQTGTCYVPYRWDKKAGAIVQMWLSGEAGGKAIADVLFGKVNPSGKLAETFPTRLRDDMEHIGLGNSITYKEKLEVGYRYYDRHTDQIWYPFGHGLSYTSFAYTGLEAKTTGDHVSLRFDITNTGDVAGKEVAQIYIGKKESAFDRPVKELKAFTKVEIAPGETKAVSVEIPLSDLACYDVAGSEWTVEKGEYQVFVGASAQDIRLSDNLYVK